MRFWRQKHIKNRQTDESRNNFVILAPACHAVIESTHIYARALEVHTTETLHYSTVLRKIQSANMYANTEFPLLTMTN